MQQRINNYRIVNNTIGWVVFLIASAVYLLTIESTASFWDCSEFIASAYKLEVGHPPGSPIFMLVANIISGLAGGDKAMIAVWINRMSAVLSGLTILFLFWTITHLVRKIVLKKEDSEPSLWQYLTIMGSGAVGALVYTFTDTFWFSAVEGEVYAFSSFMTAVVFWLILKWEDVADEPHSDKWLILIAYVIGVSVAVHLLNLLCIPAIVLVYYFKKHDNPNLRGCLLALLVSFGIIVGVLYGLIQGLVEVCGLFELLFVNTFGLPYNSGVYFYIILIAISLIWGIWESMRENPDEKRAKIAFIVNITLLGIPFIGPGYVFGSFLILILALFLFLKKNIKLTALNTILLCLLVMTIGYSSYALIMIRATSNPPMNENAPKDVFTLRTYLTREQYGETPLIYGQTYASEVKREAKNGMCVPVMKDNGPVWSRIIKKNRSDKDHYYVSGRNQSYEYVDEMNMLFPRMYSDNPSHISAYKDWANIKGQRVTYSNCGNQETAVKPTFGENIKFFISYQLNFMYWRYFMWNFSGRQNDIQGNGEVSNGNWITGIKFIDSMLVGPQDNLPDDIIHNKGHNVYYMLPLLLGILGLLFQAYSDKKGIKQFWVVFMLFFMTGIAIVLYLNQTPYQPRERDYAYAGSFYAFSIWIGFGVAAIGEILKKYLKMKELSAAIVPLLALLVPIQMAGQNWDDHDRSGRYVARDFGENYLMTCPKNSIIFTNGDNDTFPLWYAQEVEGFRTDVRVCNLSYLQTDWYIDQMKRQAYESSPLPIDWTKSQYIEGKHDVAYIFDLMNKPMDLGTAIDWVRSDDARFKQVPGYNTQMDFIPSAQLYLNVDPDAVIRAGIVRPDQKNWIDKQMVMNFRADSINGVPAKDHLTKQELMILDMLKNNKDWKRPIYYAATVSPDLFLRLDKYFRQEGIAYRIVPFDTKKHNQSINSDLMYESLMHKYKWGGIDKKGVYLDENVRRMAKTFRMLFGSLASQLIKEGKKDKAEKVLDYSQKAVPDFAVFYDYSAMPIAQGYENLGQKAKALKVYNEIATYTMKNLRWYERLNDSQFSSINIDLRYNLSTMQEVLSAYQRLNSKLMLPYVNDFNRVASRYYKIVQPDQAGMQQGGDNE